MFAIPKDDENEDFYCSMEPNPFFHVPDAAEEISADTIPNDGFEYIQLVKRERERDECLNVSAPKIPKKEEKSTKYYVPSSEERKFMRSIFFKARCLIKPKHLKEKYSLKANECLPSRNDILSWCAFCLGKEMSCEFEKNCHPKYLKMKEDHTFDPKGYDPYCRFVCSMCTLDQVKLLSFADIWLKRFGFSRRLGLWIYALLLVIERPLKQNAEEVLSYLAGTCTLIRPKLKEEGDIINIYRIICAINAYFECKPKVKVSSSNKADTTAVKDIKPIIDTEVKKLDASSEGTDSSSEDSDAMMY